MSLCNLAAHATRRVVRGCALRRRCIVRFHSPSRGVATVYLGVGSPHLSYNTSEMFDVLDDVFYLRELARVTRVPSSKRAKISAGTLRGHARYVEIKFLVFYNDWFDSFDVSNRLRILYEKGMIRERGTLPCDDTSLSCFLGFWLGLHEKITSEIIVIAGAWFFLEKKKIDARANFFLLMQAKSRASARSAAIAATRAAILAVGRLLRLTPQSRCFQKALSSADTQKDCTTFRFWHCS